MTEEKKKLNRITMITITSTMRTLMMNENKEIANEITKNAITTMKNMINAIVIILKQNAIVAMKLIMNDVIAKNHANHKKIIEIQIIFTTITAIAAIIEVNKFLNRL